MKSSERKEQRTLEVKMNTATENVIGVVRQTKGELRYDYIKMLCDWTAWGAGLDADKLLRKVEARLI